MRVVVVGSGYVGLVSGVCLADFGHKVICVDKDSKKIANLRAGHMPIYEPGLAEMVIHNQKLDRLSFTTDLAQAMEGAEVVFIAVGTPSVAETGMADMRYVFEAAREIAHSIRGFTVIVNKSTSPVGTCDAIEAIFAEICVKDTFAVVSNPEFLREGAALNDFMTPDRVVLGVENDRAREAMARIYDAISKKDIPIVYTDRRSSELIKYSANVFLAMKVTFINEIADLCEKSGADVRDVSLGVGLDSRVGRRFLNPGPGFGGSCFPKDTLALIRVGREMRAPVRLVETLVEVNEERKLAMARKIIAACGGSVAGKKIAVLGLTYKPDTDDMRDAPSLTILTALMEAGARIAAYDPEARGAEKLLPRATMMSSPYVCVEGAEAVVIMTEWAIFKDLDLERIRSLMKTPVMVDLRNLFSAAQASGSGFFYEGVGVQSAFPADAFDVAAPRALRAAE